MPGTLAAHSAHSAHSERSLAARLNLTLVGLLWAWLAGELWFEWSISEQYGYGLFVPFLTAYLLWLRMADRPSPTPEGKDNAVLLILGLVVLAQYPIAVIFAANADWRLLAWTEAMLAMAASVLLLWHWGGWPWVKHFIPALALFLFAVPWPSLIEILLVDHLMTFVATVVTDVLHLLGYEAVRQGHVIKLPTSYVAVEEACSGVRSIQSTIMAAWLVGEWWRFRWWGRAGLLVWALMVAIFFNLLRTLMLAWIDAANGPAAMEHWHDTAGYLVFALSFGTVLGGAWLAHPKKRAVTQEIDSAKIFQPHWLPTRSVVILLVLLVGALPACAAWYALREPNISSKPSWKLNLAAVTSNTKPVTPPDSLRQTLFYDHAIQAEWPDDSGRGWALYNLQWDHARSAQLGGVHSPESCLPAVGWLIVQQGDNLVWKHGDIELIFNTYEFVHGDTHLHVFYCQWDPTGYAYFDKTGRYRSDRLLDAWNADRKQGKQLLEVAINHASSLNEATVLMRKFLDAAIIELPPDVKK